MQGLCSHDPIFLTGCDKTRFAAKLLPLVRFALGDTFHFRGMNTVELILTGMRLSQ